MKQPISLQLYNRLTKYLYYLEGLGADAPENISATTIAKALELNDVLVRKDLASVSNGGRPKTGYVTKELMADISHFLGHDNTSDAVLAGVGNLGKALMSYDNFKNYGLDIVAAFDISRNLWALKLTAKKYLHARK